jgi:hypothetical protein
MKIKSLALAVAMAATGGSAMAASCTSTFSAGSLDAPDLALIGNDFHKANSFHDCYNFSLTESSNALGATLEWDLFSGLDIDLTGVTLTGTGIGSALQGLTSSGLGISTFSFSSLAAGTYQLMVSGVVSGRPNWLDSGVGYSGKLVTTPSHIAAPVPEPKTYALLLLGLGAVAFATRRRMQG